MSFQPADFRDLGDSGLSVSPIGLGTVKFGRNTDVKYPSAFALPDDRQLAALLDVADQCGINLLDTAPAYGVSEQRLGKLLRGTRDRWIISTKVGEYHDDAGSTWDFGAGATRHSVENSLRVLHTDYLDVVLVHSDGNDEHIIHNTEVIPVLHELKHKGDVRAIGISTKTVAGGLAALAVVDVVMVTLNIDDTSQLPVIEEAARRHKGVLIKKALSSGHAREPEIALRFVLDQPGVSSVIVGTVSAEHLRENVRAASRRV